jgi:hypothetical protein
MLQQKLIDIVPKAAIAAVALAALASLAAEKPKPHFGALSGLAPENPRPDFGCPTGWTLCTKTLNGALYEWCCAPGWTCAGLIVTNGMVVGTCSSGC